MPPILLVAPGLAALALAVLRRLPARRPAIHDITTDAYNPPAVHAVLARPGEAANSHDALVGLTDDVVVRLTASALAPARFLVFLRTAR